MNISDAGVRMIVGFEGKLRPIGDGRYVAYRCPAGVWTIYAGVTEGVHEGMVCTEAEGETMFRRELIKHEAAVGRLATVPLNQNQFDALVSFSYNCGAGALAKSTLLRRLNAGDYEGAARCFAAWNKGGGRVLPGLVSRRAREASLFLKPVEQAPEPTMPHKIDEPDTAPIGSRKWSAIEWLKRLLGFGAVGGAGTKAGYDQGLDPMGAISTTANLLKLYGVEIAICATVLGVVVLQIVQHWMREDVATGRYTPSGDM